MTTKTDTPHGLPTADRVRELQERSSASEAGRKAHAAAEVEGPALAIALLPDLGRYILAHPDATQWSLGDFLSHHWEKEYCGKSESPGPWHEKLRWLTSLDYKAGPRTTPLPYPEAALWTKQLAFKVELETQLRAAGYEVERHNGSPYVSFKLPEKEEA